MAKVTVLLTSYNHAAFLRQSIESILEQSYRDYELFIVDDGSVDGSADIIRSYHDERIHVVIHEKNMCGPHWIRDLKSHMAGEYLAVAHCDDMWLPGKLKKQVEYLDAHPECGACFTDVQVIDENGRPYTEEDGFYFNLFSQKNRSRFEWLRRFFYEGNCLCHPSILIRMTCYDAYRMTDTESLFSIPDYYQWVRLALHTDLYVYPEKLACFRVRKQAGNTSGDKPDGHIRSSFEMFKLLSCYLELRDRPEDFLKVFPSALQYVRDGRICVEYAYARILLDESDKPVFNLLGLLILQKLLDAPETCARLEREYGYTRRNFAAESGGRDLFNTMGEGRFMISSLFWDDGNGFSATHYVTKTNYTGFTGRFESTFDFPDGLTGVQGLRFDPDEGAFRTFENVVLRVDGETFVPEAAGLTETKGDSILFFSSDPQFIVKFPEKRAVHTVTVTGLTSRMPHAEVERAMIAQKEKAEDELARTRLKAKDDLALAEVKARDELALALAKARKDRAQISSVFWNTGDSFCEAQHITQECEIDEQGHFELSMTFTEALRGVSELRFDPDEETFREYSDIHIRVNGRSYSPVVCGASEVEGKTIFFFTTDPQFLVAFQEKTDIYSVEVSGDTRRVSSREFDERTNRRIQAVRAQAEQSVQEMAKNLETARREQTDADSSYSEERARYENQLQAYAREFEARREYLVHHRLKASVKALLGRLWTD